MVERTVLIPRCCVVTGHPCGTDTWQVDNPCNCSQCCLWMYESLVGARRERDNLLARIHRDGGQYTAQHGAEKSVADADLLVANRFAELDEARADLADEQAKVDVLTRRCVLLGGERDAAREALRAISRSI